MIPPLRITAAAEHEAAIRAVSELLEKLKLQCAFVGSVALSAWLGRLVDAGPVDVLAMLTPERMRQVPMMASHRGFSVDSNEIESAEELDLIPLKHRGIRVHVLMATNALYGRMVAESVTARMGDTDLRVLRAEDLALLLLIAEDTGTIQELIESVPGFELEGLNRKLAMIGLRERMISR